MRTSARSSRSSSARPDRRTAEAARRAADALAEAAARDYTAFPSGHTEAVLHSRARPRAAPGGYALSGESLGPGRVPPQSIEAEEAVLGAILLDNRALDRANEIVQADDFYREAHRRIFRALNDLDDRRERADVITLIECLKRRGDLEAVGGAAAIAELVGNPRVVNPDRLLRRMARKRGWEIVPVGGGGGGTA